MRFIYTKYFVVFFLSLVLVTGLVFLETTNRAESLKKFLLAVPRPIILLTKNISRPVKNFFVTLYNLRGMARENQNLLVKVMKLEKNLVDYENEQKQNEVLRRELGFVKSTKLGFVPCSIISRNAFGYDESVVLDCGSLRGIKEGSGLVAEGFLVGKVIQVGNLSSVALLIRAANFTTDAKVSKSNTEGLVKGSYGFGIILDQIPQEAKLEKGELVATAGIDQRIPKNIPIGEIGDPISGNSELLKQMTVISPIDLKNLENIFVVE
jgi:rod shape-determining protein MreC